MNKTITNVIKRTGALAQRLSPACERVGLPLLLLLWPFANAAQGLDVADTTYSMTNYVYQEGLDPMWLLATWLPNLLGAAFSRLPGGGTLFGMGLCCTGIVALTAELVYFGCRRWGLFRPGALFLGLWIAEGLCWCPTVILYNYLTYLFLTAAAVLLLGGFAQEEGRARRRHYIAAGVCLGLNVFVRFPNAAEALLILAVWYREALAPGAEEGQGSAAGVRGAVRRALRATGACLLGYLLGLAGPMLAITLSYGPAAYLRMIGGLFSMTEGAADYTLGGMLLSVLGAYGTTLRELLLAVPVVATGFAGFLLTDPRWGLREDGAEELGGGKRRRLRLVSFVLYVLLVLLLLRLYFSWGVITRNYWYYDCMFELAMMVLVGAIALCLGGLRPGFWPEGAASFGPPACLLALAIVAVTPLGSNNYTFPVINNLFVVLPVALSVCVRAVEGRARIRAAGGRALGLAAGTLYVMLLLLLLVQASLFHLRFAFGDGTDGIPRDAVAAGVPRAWGRRTTQDNARSLSELYRELHDGHREALAASGGRALILGNAPGLHYLLELRPALFTAWPDLDSNALTRVELALTELAASGERPLAILRRDLSSYPETAGFQAGEKADLVLDYLAEIGYNKLFEVPAEGSAVYEVWAAE